MKVKGFSFEHGNLMIDIQAETHCEKALLAHFQLSEHTVLLCGGPFENERDDAKPKGLQIFMRDKCELEYRREIECELGRKKKLERRANPRSKK
jgi:hypothetical protein